MKKRILFFCENVTLAHVIRPVQLAKELNKDNYEIIFACDEHYANFIKAEGFKVIHLNSQSNKEFTDKLFYAKQLFTNSQINNYLEEEFKILDEINPDLVVGDFRLTLGISCRVKNILYFSIINSRWSIYAEENVILPLMHIQKFIPFKILNFIFPLIWPFVKKQQIKPYNKFQKKYNLPRIKNIKEMYCDADYILYDDIPSITKLINKQDNHIFLGPVLWQPKIDFSKEIKQIPSNKKVIYFSMGSSGNLNQELIDVLSDDNYLIFMSSAGKTNNVNLPSNFIVYDFIPALDILKKCDLSITNGGVANYQAFSRNVPVLMFPSNMDQYLFADSCEKNNLGIYLRLENSNKESIQTAINNILNNLSIRDNVIKTKKEIDKFCSKKIFANLIDNILK